MPTSPMLRPETCTPSRSMEVQTPPLRSRSPPGDVAGHRQDEPQGVLGHGAVAVVGGVGDRDAQLSGRRDVHEVGRPHPDVGDDLQVGAAREHGGVQVGPVQEDGVGILDALQQQVGLVQPVLVSNGRNRIPAGAP